jgi:small subunit ribosomal protein S4
VFQKGLAKSIQQSRQLIAHGHIAINGRRVSSPSYLVLKDEESKLSYSPKSPLINAEHPLTKSIDIQTQKSSLNEEEDSHE